MVTARQCDPESWAYGTVEAVGTGIATQGWFPLHYVHFDRQVCNLWHGRWKSLPHPRLPDVQNVTVQSLARQMEVAAEHSNGHYDRRARGVRRNDHYDRRATEVRVREDMDEICCNKTTGARLYVGNWDASRNFDRLITLRIFRIVNCTDNIRDWHKRHYRFKYHKFNIAAFDPGFHDAHQFVQDMVDFVSTSLSENRNVLIHCAAGAHRGGTTGIICLMYLECLGAEDAIRRASECRPEINSDGEFRTLLNELDERRA